MSGTSFDLHFTVILELPPPLLSAHDRGYKMLHPEDSTEEDIHISHTTNLSTHTCIHTYTYAFKDPSSAQVGLNVEIVLKRARLQYAIKSNK